MDIISYTSFRQNLASLLDKVNLNHKPIMITRKNGEHAVVMSARDFASYEETAYLMKSPKNAERLLTSIDDVNAGHHTPRDLIEE